MSSKRGDITLSVRGLGKKYRIATSLANTATTIAESLLFLWKGRDKAKYSEFWANRDISFDLREGDIVGVVGRNGAGKSTLLKLLSRITEPTEGAIDLYGRVGSLLEVGTGFHPELTGRENIFLNGAILGMTRRETTRQFDAIVEFAEIEPFLDTPVKRYSSGMYVRLAFAVAAHLNPEILIVDEVLAVGDTRFQRKCLGKMHDVAQSGGRTVLFVSHSMTAVRTLCNRALFLKDGRLILDSSTDAVSELYTTDAENAAAEMFIGPEKSPSPDFYLRAVRVRDSDDAVALSVDLRDPFNVEIEYTVSAAIANLRMNFTMRTSEGVLVCSSFDPEWPTRPRHMPGDYVVHCRFPPHTLNEGTFLIDVMADVPNERVLQQTDHAVSFRVEDTVGYGPNADKLTGIIRPAVGWSTPTL
ncbi:MAG: ABC transporter ATP-binding protein [Akkermansiaceae bacterium]|nr:ABC transporter ATP-binding protein [Armatimonadota bacterium]